MPWVPVPAAWPGRSCLGALQFGLSGGQRCCNRLPARLLPPNVLNGAAPAPLTVFKLRCRIVDYGSRKLRRFGGGGGGGFGGGGERALQESRLLAASIHGRSLEEVLDVARSCVHWRGRLSLAATVLPARPLLLVLRALRPAWLPLFGSLTGLHHAQMAEAGARGRARPARRPSYVQRAPRPGQGGLKAGEAIQTRPRGGEPADLQPWLQVDF